MTTMAPEAAAESLDPRDPLLTTMIDVQARTGGSVVALMEVPKDQVNLYGCAAISGRRSGHGAPSRTAK